MKPRTFSGDLAALPAVLRPLTEHRRWVVWRWLQKKPSTKWTKPPYRADDPSAFAQSDEPSTWSTYAAALAAVQAGKADGIGYMLTHADGLPNGTGAIDLDKCRDPDTGQLAAWAQELIGETDSYVEATVSGTGLRIVGFVDGTHLHTSLATPDEGGIEFFRHATRFITITGMQIGNCGELRNIDELIDHTYEKFAGEAVPRRSKVKPPPGKRKVDLKPIPPSLAALVAKNPVHQPEVIAEAKAWLELLKRAYDVIPNDDLPRKAWDEKTAALYNATCGTDAGLEIALAFAKKSKKHHNEATVVDRWRHWDRSPYTQLYPESIFYWAWEAAGDFWWRAADDYDEPEPKAKTKPTDIVSVRLVDVDPKPIEWVWKHRIARGKITILSGDPGVSKSLLSLDIAARLTTAAMWPDGYGKAPLGSIIILSAEDDVADTIRVRFAAAGGDASKCHVLQAVMDRRQERTFDLTCDLPSLRGMIEDIGDVIAIIADPINAYMGRPGKLNSFRDTDLRGVLTPLAKIAADMHVAVIAIVHLTKDGRRSALMSVMGSVAMVAAARSVFLVIEDAADPKRILFLRTKSNIAPKGDNAGMAYRLHERPTGLEIVPYAPGLVWETEGIAMTADEAIAANRASHDKRRNPDIDAAAAIINEMLAKGDRPAAEIQARLKAEGFGQSTCRNARAKCGVEAYQPEIPGPWFWRIVM